MKCATCDKAISLLGDMVVCNGVSLCAVCFFRSRFVYYKANPQLL